MPLQELIDAARRENTATSYFKKHTRDIAQGVSRWMETCRHTSWTCGRLIPDMILGAIRKESKNVGM